jgi:LacI family transcriptional regulator
MQLIEAQRIGEKYDGPSTIVLPVEIVPGRTLLRPRTAQLTVP